VHYSNAKIGVPLKEQNVLWGELIACLSNLFLVITPLKKAAKAMVSFVIGFLVIAVFIVDYGSTDYAQSDEKDFKKKPITPTPTPVPPLPTISPPPNLPFASLRTTFSNAPCSFEIGSPSNMTYTSNSIILSVAGSIFGAKNINLSLSYSVDGKGKRELPIDPKPPEDHFSFFGHFSESIAITDLSDGIHWIVVFGYLKVNGVSEFGESIVYFTINQNPVKLWT